MELTDRLRALAGRKGDEECTLTGEKGDEEESLAKRAVIHEWENWAALHPDDLKNPGVRMFFFMHLQEKKPELLNFSSSGDKRQIIEAWLLRNDRFKDLVDADRSQIWNWGQNSQS
jgi:hypothetical protein